MLSTYYVQGKKGSRGWVSVYPWDRKFTATGNTNHFDLISLNGVFSLWVLSVSFCSRIDAL